jgi:hypothetical protein
VSEQSREAACATCNGEGWIPDAADGTEIPCPSCNAGDPPRLPRDFVSFLNQPGFPTGFTVNCHLCSARLTHLRTEGAGTEKETFVFRCPRHGVLILPPDGRIRQQPS